MTKYIIYIIAIACFSSCGSKQSKTEPIAENTKENEVELSEAQLKNANIETSILEQKSISSLLKVNGNIEAPPQNAVSVSVPLGGYIKSTKLLPGMHISKGETIAIMEDQEYITMQQDYLTAKAKIVYTEAEYNRQTELNKSKAVSDKIYQQAKAEYASQNILVKSLSEKLKLIGINPDNLSVNNLSRSINIPSPISGYVSKVNVNIGKYVNPTDILFELVNPSDIHLALNVFEKNIDKLFIGQTLMAYTNSNPERKYPCKIILIGKDVNQDHSIEVHCHFEQYDKILIPGMFMNAEIEIQSHTGFVIPTDAIVRFEGKQYVFAVTENNKYEMLEVSIHNNENDYTQISFADNLDRSQNRFVTKGAYTLLMKMKNTEEE